MVTTKTIKPKKGPGRPKKENRGGKREGAGRKKGFSVAYPDEQLTSQVTLRVRDITHKRVKQLRELTKNDAMNFNRMFEKWVEDYAKDYGIE